MDGCGSETWTDHRRQLTPRGVRISCDLTRYPHFATAPSDGCSSGLESYSLSQVEGKSKPCLLLLAVCHDNDLGRTLKSKTSASDNASLSARASETTLYKMLHNV